MLEYPIEEAAALLKKNLSAAQQSLQEVGEDLDFISDQCTIVEVGILQPILFGVVFSLLVARNHLAVPIISLLGDFL